MVDFHFFGREGGIQSFSQKAGYQAMEINMLAGIYH